MKTENEIKNLYSNKEYCLKEISQTRKFWNDPQNNTMEKWDVVIETLGFMLMYCPESISYIVQATLTEANMRMSLSLPKIN